MSLFRKRKNKKLSKGRQTAGKVVLVIICIWLAIGLFFLIKGIVTYKGTDAETSSEVQLTDITKDTTGPVISGVTDKTVKIGDTISYKEGVTITDDTDDAPTLTIDADEVNLSKAGTYSVYYEGVDASGNKTTVIGKVTVEAEETTEAVADEDNPNYDEMIKLAKAVVADATSEDDSDLEKLYNVYWEIKNPMQFTGSSDKTNWIDAAIEGFKTYSGDCYTHFAMMKALMRVMGFETIDIEREGGDTHHYWNLVKYQGEWYHIDSCPRSEDKDKYWYCFLRTDQELLDWDKKQDAAKGYYNFDSSKYPATATEPLNLGSMQSRN